MEKGKRIWGWMVLVSLFILGAAGLGRTESEPSLVAHWRFDEGKGEVAKDSSLNGNDGVIHGASWVDGVRGSGLRFTGDDWVDCGTKIRFGKKVTIIAWFQTTAMGRNFVVMKYASGTGPQMEASDGRFRTGIRQDGKNPVDCDVNPETTYNDGQFHQGVLIWDPPTLYQYLDGRLTGTATNSAIDDINIDLIELRIGKLWGEDVTFGFKGIIDEVKIYNRAFNVEEVEKEYKDIAGVSSLTAVKEKKRATLLGLIQDMQTSLGNFRHLPGGEKISEDLDRLKEEVETSREIEGLEKEASELRDRVAGFRTEMISGSKESIVVWGSSPMDKIFKDRSLPEKANTEDVFMECCRNEYEPVQIGVSSYKYTGSLRVALTPLVHSAGEYKIEDIMSNFVGYVYVTKPSGKGVNLRREPSYFPDPLLLDKSVSIGPGETQPVWITVKVPKEALSGDYEGKIKVLTEQGEHSLNLHLKVWPVTLSDDSHLWFNVWGGETFLVEQSGIKVDYTKFFSPGSPKEAVLIEKVGVKEIDPKYWEFLKKVLMNQKEHHKNVFSDICSWNVLRLVRTFWQEGGYYYDYSTFDRLMETVTEAYGNNARIIDVSFSLGGGGSIFLDDEAAVYGEDGKKISEKSIPVKTPVDDPKLKVFISTFFTAMEKHLKEKGWLDKVFFKVSDEPSGKETINAYKRVAKLIKEVAPGIKLSATVVGVDLAGCEYIDLEILGSDLTKSIENIESKKKGQEKWVYNNGWSNISSSLMDTRIWGWIAYRYSLAGLSQWGWAYARNPWKNPDSAFGAGDDFKVYPDPEKKEAVVNSIRWEIMREMIEDYEYLYMLEKKTKDPQVVKDLCSQLVQSLGEYEHNPENLYKVRHTILEKLILPSQ